MGAGPADTSQAFPEPMDVGRWAGRAGPGTPPSCWASFAAGAVPVELSRRAVGWPGHGRDDAAASVLCAGEGAASGSLGAPSATPHSAD